MRALIDITSHNIKVTFTIRHNRLTDQFSFAFNDDVMRIWNEMGSDVYDQIEHTVRQMIENGTSDREGNLNGVSYKIYLID